MRIRQIIFLLSALLVCRVAVAQSGDRLVRIKESLDSLAAVDARYNEPIDLSVTNFSVADLLKTIAIENSLNVNLSLDKIRGLNIFEYEHFLSDFVCKFRFFHFQGLHDMLFCSSVYSIQDIYHCIHTTDNCVILIYQR